jgi:hypothetical protein
MKNIFALLAALILVAGCGGGGGDGGTATPLPATSTLEGVWIYASAKHYTGGACGLDVHGNYEDRITVKFAGSKYDVQIETCLILKGNTGSFIQNNAGSGTFKTGGVFYTLGSRAYSEIDMTITGQNGSTATVYGGYNISGTELRMTDTSGDFDGTTTDRRQRGVPFEQPVFIKQ